MAKMYPERLPEGRASDAEYDLFAAFEHELDEHFTVYAGVSWLATGRRGGAREGEADFVISHPERGILVVEVKGGQIGRAIAAGAWHSVDRHGQRHAITDPVEQARRNSHALSDKLNEAPETARYTYPIGYAVALPDIRLSRHDLGLDAPADIIIDSDDYGAMQAAVERVMRNALGDRQARIGSQASGR